MTIFDKYFRVKFLLFDVPVANDLSASWLPVKFLVYLLLLVVMYVCNEFRVSAVLAYDFHLLPFFFLCVLSTSISGSRTSLNFATYKVR